MKIEAAYKLILTFFEIERNCDKIKRQNLQSNNWKAKFEMEKIFDNSMEWKKFHWRILQFCYQGDGSDCYPEMLACHLGRKYGWLDEKYLCIVNNWYSHWFKSSIQLPCSARSTSRHFLSAHLWNSLFVYLRSCMLCVIIWMKSFFNWPSIQAWHIKLKVSIRIGNPNRKYLLGWRMFPSQSILGYKI